MELSSIYKPVADQLSSVEAVISDCLFRQGGTDLSDRIGSFVNSSPGKRLRPALVLLSANACTNGRCTSEYLFNIAAAMELTHIASLIHDDVIDSAPMRHNRPTVNSKWQGNIGIIFGDYVYSRAMSLISTCNDTDVFSCLSQTVISMCQGQLTQVTHRDNFDLSRQDYLSIVSRKTASLFSSSCRVAGLLEKAEAGIVDSLADFGDSFGIAFQIVDDYCDIMYSQDSLGKLPGQDIMLGEITLPIMNLLSVSPANKKANLIELLKAGSSNGTMKEIRDAFVASDAPEMTRKTILSHIDKAAASLSALTQSEYKDSLDLLLELLVSKITAESKA